MTEFGKPDFVGKTKGMWLYWCDVDGYSQARCSCTKGKQTWLPNWDAAVAADRARRKQSNIEYNICEGR